MKVLRGFKNQGIDGDLLRAFKVLYPGDIETDIMKMNAALVADRHMPTTVGSFSSFLASFKEPAARTARAVISFFHWRKNRFGCYWY